MQKLVPLALLGVLLAAELACGAGGGASAPQTAAPISVRLIGPAQLAVGAQGGFTVTVTGTTNTAVTWTTTGGSISADGLLTAPNTSGPVTVTATSVADPSKAASMAVAIVQGVAVAVSGPASLAPGATGTFTATVTGTSNTAVTWTASAGTIGTDGNFTSPGTVGPVTITATSVADASKSASTTVAVAVPMPAITLTTSAPRPAYATSGQEYSVTANGVLGDSLTWSAANAVVTSGQGSPSITVKPSIPGRPFAVSLATTNAAGSATASWQGTVVSLPEGPLQAPTLVQPGRTYRVGLPGFRPGLDVRWGGVAANGSYGEFTAPSDGTVFVSALASNEALSTYAGSGEIPVTHGVYGRLWQGYAYSSGNAVMRGMSTGQILLGPGAVAMNSGWHVSNPSTGQIEDLQGTLPGGTRTNVATADTGNGSVLVIGGARGATYTGQIDRVTPGLSNPFTTLSGSLSTLRASCSAVALGNGKVLVAGGSVPGSPSTYIASAELIDTTTGVVTPASLAPDARLGGSLVASGGKAYWLGGRVQGGGQAPNWVYDPTSDTWNAIADNITPRTAPVLVLRDGRILSYGGSTAAGTRLNNLEIYDPVANTWRAQILIGGLWPDPAPATPSIRAAELPNGGVLFIGSSDTSKPVADAGIWDTASTWYQAHGPSQRGVSVMVSTDTGVAAYGGVTQDGLSSYTATTYDAELDQWADSGSDSAEAAALAAAGPVIRAASSGSTVIVTDVPGVGSLRVDGNTGDTTAASGYVTQAEGALIPLPGGKALRVGGGASGPAIANCQLFDGVSWTTTGGLNQGRAGFTWITLADGRVLVAGGSATVGGVTPLTSTEIYNPSTGTWAFGPTLARGRSGGTLAERGDGKVLMIGGGNNGVAQAGELLDLVANSRTDWASSLDATSVAPAIRVNGNHYWITWGNGGVLLDADSGSSVALSGVVPAGNPAALPDGRLLWGGRIHSMVDGSATLTGSAVANHPKAVTVPLGVLALGGGVPEIYVP